MSDKVSNQEYLRFTRKTAVYPKDQAISYLALGLGNEAGEVQGKIKKLIRGDYSDINNISISVVDELGDIVWYITRLADEFGFTLDDVISANVKKLNRRLDNNTIKGDGDER